MADLDSGRLASRPTEQAALDRVTAERDYLLARAYEAGRCRFDEYRWTGISSNALVRYVFGGEPPAPHEFPHDPSDMLSCVRAVLRLPEHLRGRGEAVLRVYRPVVEARYSLAVMDALLAAEAVPQGTKNPEPSK